MVNICCLCNEQSKVVAYASILRRTWGRFRKKKLFLLRVVTKEYVRHKWSSQIFQYVVVSIISNLKMGGLMPLSFSIVCLCVGVLVHFLRWSDAPASVSDLIGNYY